MDPVSQFFPEINRFFDHVYVITLQRAAERHEHISRELAGLEYELFFGHDKNHFSIEELKLRRIYDEQLAIAHHRFGKPLVPGMIGCSWSHREVYEDIIRKNYRNALVLEDDVVIDRKHMHLVHEILSEVPPDWELLYLGYARNEKKPVLSTLKKLIYHIQRLLRNH
ncbi:MAG TPA: glycosyltransferase family 25 protein, partial [Flavisolibacter sp.]